MANVSRYKYGDTKPVVASCQSATDIEIGDLVFLEGVDGALKNLRPASQLDDLGSIAANQIYFKCRFLGHASQRHRTAAVADPDDVTDIRVNTAGVHEYICASTTWELGDLVAPAENAAGTALLDQTVIVVPRVSADADRRAIGRVAQREAVATTRVYIELSSEIMDGGVDAGTCSGSSSSGS